VEIGDEVVGGEVEEGGEGSADPQNHDLRAFDLMTLEVHIDLIPTQYRAQ
jgi:hypothetical protein